MSCINDRPCDSDSSDLDRWARAALAAFHIYALMSCLPQLYSDCGAVAAQGDVVAFGCDLHHVIIKLAVAMRATDANVFCS